MARTIFTVVEKCVACKSCEIACIVEHSSTKTLFGALGDTPRPKQRVRVEKVGAFSYPSRCMHCDEAACITACPTGAMQRDARTSAVFSDGDKCIGCWMCVMVCPFGGVNADPVGKKALKCDRCPDRTLGGNDPACVSACPTKALLFLTPDELANRRRQSAAAAAVGQAQATAQTGMDILRSLKGDI